MLFERLLEDVGFTVVSAAGAGLAGEAVDIQFDSRRVAPGAVFLGMAADPVVLRAHVEQAVAAGAGLVVTQIPINVEATAVVVDDVRAAAGPIASTFFGHPSRELKIVAITGTNGKSSVTYLLSEMLGVLGYQTGTVGTLGLTFAGNPVDFPTTTPTTPEAVDLQRLFRAYRDMGGTHVVIEASSQALARHRIDATSIEVGVFTNLTQDHLDAHGSMDAYRDAKLQLFPMCRRVVAGVDDEVGRQVHNTWGGVTFGNRQQADLAGRDIRQTPSGLAFTVATADGQQHPATMRALGEFSVLNGLAALGVCQQLGIPLEDALTALATARSAPGRMQVVATAAPYTVLVDYAHSPDSLEQVLHTVRATTEGRVITVFGCGGDRDAVKRPIMGDVAGRLSDLVVLTSDNPRSEDPKTIMSDVAKGLRAVPSGAPWVEIVDRGDAIEHALAEASAGDLVLVAGKGDEPYQIIGDEKFPFSDVEVVQERQRRLLR
jgi:UDP-N-acetylmuramoyl-L-alanyl-D-glutamate--2,6-diaminopimelate ligase